ncbi:MAG TPA: SDR family oxidoreductase [Sphingobium sp.]|nr:SDR family oxidoreductase [Sphingobium sp.]
MSRKIAFITGASRGIGKACAIELAEAGFDVAITARTVKEGEAREHSSTVARTDTTPLPGSLDSTTALCEAKGVRAMAVFADLLEPHTVGAAVTQVLERWGRIDVVVHNGRYIGPGHMDRFLDTPIDLLRKQMEANVMAPLIINQLVLPSMIANGGGTFINITSTSAYGDPINPAGKGGWGMGYGVTKGAFQRIAGIIKAEHGDQGVRTFNVQPGFIATERMAQDMGKFGFVGGVTPYVPAKVVAWLATNPEADAFNGKTIEAQQFCHERGLMPGWEGPFVSKVETINYDYAGYNRDQIGKRERAALAAADK